MPWMHYVKSEDHSWGDHNVQTLCVSGNWPKKINFVFLYCSV